MNKKLFSVVILVVFALQMYGQSVAEKLKTAVNSFLSDAQLKHAVVSMYVTDENGNEVFALNEQYGLAPASTQKIFTSAAAFSLLGKDFTYKTQIGYIGLITHGLLNGDIIIKGYGDPTLGSWRYGQTKPETFLNFIVASIKKAGIEKINGNVILDDGAFSYQPTPGGYPWEDMGNYYGSGSWAINWRENQYDLILKPGNNIGDTSAIIKTSPTLAVDEFSNFITTAEPNSGDNTMLYLPPYGSAAFAEGTIPKGVKSFTVSGAIAYAAGQLKTELDSALQQNNLPVSGTFITGAAQQKKGLKILPAQTNITTYTSPSLDSIVFWFLQKSVNLYGECLLKTISYQQENYGSTDAGVAVLKKFWQQQGIDSSALNIADGSGLSPKNRVTTVALVNALLYAQKQNWFKSFYAALPLYNNMKLKSGTISAVKAFAGYHTASNGKKYVVAIIVNNYNTAMGSVTPKIFKVLDVLK